MGRSSIDKVCFGKSRYESADSAIEVADYVFEMNKIRLFVYKCPICGGWHLTRKFTKRK